MHVSKTADSNGLNAFVFYVFLQPLSLFLAAVAWAHWASDVLYRCTDCTFEILDIIPPFVHAGTGDVYLVSAWRVWASWGCLITAAVGLPLLATWYLWRLDSCNEP